MRKARRLIRQVDQLTEFRGLSRLPNIEDCDRAMREAVADFLVSDYAAELMKSPPEVLPARWVVGALSWKLELMAHMVVRLVERGDEYAIVALARVVGPMVKAMNRVARTQPESLRGVPHQVPHWPVLKSLHSEFDDDHEGLLELLEVGKGLPFTLGREARWKANDAVGRWVLYLVTQIEALHDSLLLDSDADWFKAAVGLDELSAENWEQWWSIMQGMLRDEYVDVIEIPVLNDTVTSRTDRKSPGRIRARIYKNLKERLRSLAGLNKV